MQKHNISTSKKQIYYEKRESYENRDQIQERLEYLNENLIHEIKEFMPQVSYHFKGVVYSELLAPG